MQRHRISAILKTDKKNDKGQLPIYIRITIAGKRSHSSTGYYIRKELWDKSGQCVKELHPLHQQINTAITDKKKELLQTLLHANIAGHTFSATALKKQTDNAAVYADFFAFAEARSNELTHKRKASTLANWDKHLSHLEAYNGSRNLDFSALTADFFSGFENYMRGEGLSQNYMYAIIKTIRGVINSAWRKGVTVPRPFKQYEMPEYTAANKEHLSLSELDQWQAYYVQAQTKKQRAAIAYFLLGCYTGLRISDWYLFDLKEHLKDDYIRIRAKKNGHWVTMPVHRRLRETLELVKANRLEMSAENLTTLLGTLAKKAGINKHISSHCARKTFAVTMCLDRGISSEAAAELMGITLDVFVKSYSRITPEKIKKETDAAWRDL